MGWRRRKPADVLGKFGEVHQKSCSGRPLASGQGLVSGPLVNRGVKLTLAVKMSQKFDAYFITTPRGLPPRTWSVSDSFLASLSMSDAYSTAFKVTRALVQTLSNIVTTNDALTSKLWETHMNLPEEQVILVYDYHLLLRQTCSSR